MSADDDLDPTDLPAQERASAKRRRQLRRDWESAKNEIRWLMRGERGRHFVWRLLDRTGVFRSTFSPEATAMAFAEGNRNVGLYTLNLIHAHCPELYATMVAENAGPIADDVNDSSSH